MESKTDKGLITGYLRIRPSIYMVCSPVDFEPEVAHDQLLAICNTPHKDRNLIFVTRRHVSINKK